MMEKKRSEGKNSVDTKAGNIVKITSNIIGLGLFAVISIILFFIFHRLIYGLQILMYQRIGETLIGSSNIVVGILALVIGLDCFILDFLYKFTEERYPVFFYKYCFDTNSKIRINEDIWKKFKLVALGFIILGIGFVYFFFHEYISLSNRYIAASVASMFNNRQEYNYSDIKIVERLPRSSNESTVYRYEFPAGKELSNIGAFAGDTIKAIHARQKNLSIGLSKVSHQSSTKSQKLRSLIAYFIWLSSFFFIPLTLKKLLLKKKK